MSNRIARSSMLRWVSAVVIVISVVAIMRQLPMQEAVSQAEGVLEKLGPWAPIGLGVVYVIATVLLAPASVLTLAAGALFGLWTGFVTVSLASTAGATLAFLIARYLARARVERLIAGRPALKAIDRAIEEGGWRIVALLRLSPAVPFNVQNYFYGLTTIPLRPYVLASWIAMMPGTFMYVYVGHITGAAVGGRSGRSPMEWALLVAGLLATVVVTVYITRLARRQLKNYTSSEENSDFSPKAAPGAPDEARAKPLLPVLAAISAAIAIGVTLNSDRIGAAIKSAFGPPVVELKEAYADDAGDRTFDHRVFDSLLRKHVSVGGWVDYAGIKSDQPLLSEYLESLKEAPFDDLGRDEKLALLINAYNAFTLQLIVDHYPIDSIRDIASEERWDARRWRVGRYTWSLNEIEHEQIRPKFADPRIHFALVCAAIGCPPLRNEAYDARRLEQQLEDQARYVHTHERWFQYTPGSDRILLTSLYDWYGSDFEQVAGSVLAFAGRYSTDLHAALDAEHPPLIQWINYDWMLNDVTNRPQ